MQAMFYKMLNKERSIIDTEIAIMESAMSLLQLFSTNDRKIIIEGFEKSHVNIIIYQYLE